MVRASNPALQALRLLSPWRVASIVSLTFVALAVLAALAAAAATGAPLVEHLSQAAHLAQAVHFTPVAYLTPALDHIATFVQNTTPYGNCPGSLGSSCHKQGPVAL